MRVFVQRGSLERGVVDRPRLSKRHGTNHSRPDVARISRSCRPVGWRCGFRVINPILYARIFQQRELEVAVCDVSRRISTRRDNGRDQAALTERRTRGSGVADIIVAAAPLEVKLRIFPVTLDH